MVGRSKERQNKRGTGEKDVEVLEDAGTHRDAVKIPIQVQEKAETRGVLAQQGVEGGNDYL